MTLIQRFLELLLTRNASILMVGYGLLNLIAHSQHEIKAKSLSDLKWHLAEVAPISEPCRLLLIIGAISSKPDAVRFHLDRLAQHESNHCGWQRQMIIVADYA